jgi:hypothetical protein
MESHYFASSIGAWQTSTNLRGLMREMDKDGLEYSLWLVPLPEDAEYEIVAYRPAVPKAIFLGIINPEDEVAQAEEQEQQRQETR